MENQKIAEMIEAAEEVVSTINEMFSTAQHIDDLTGAEQFRRMKRWPVVHPTTGLTVRAERLMKLSAAIKAVKAAGF